MTDRPGRTSYPPPGHILSTLGIEFAWRDEVTLEGRVLADAALLSRQDGRPAGMGPLVPIVDVIAGSCISPHLDGDWMATADVWLHEREPIGSGPLSLTARVLRAGKRSLIAAVEVASGPTASATATVEFSRIRRDASPHRGNPADATGAWRRMGEGPLLDQPIETACGIRVVDGAAGVVEVDRAPFVANSIGTLQGGVVALLADVAASVVVSPSARTVDLQFRFLAQTGDGPATTSTEIIRTDSDGAVVRVSVIDAADDTLVGWALCRVIDS